MRHVYVGFSSPRQWFQPFSWLIRKWQATQYSHVFVIFPAQFLEGLSETHLICEAAHGSVRTVAAKFFFPNVKIWTLYKIQIDDATFRKSFGVGASYLGAHYSLRENAGIVLADWLRLKRNPLGEGSVGQKCSETTFYILQALGFNFDSALDPDLIDPKNIEQTLFEMAQGHPAISFITGPEASDLDLM